MSIITPPAVIYRSNSPSTSNVTSLTLRHKYFRNSVFILFNGQSYKKKSGNSLVGEKTKLPGRR